MTVALQVFAALAKLTLEEREAWVDTALRGDSRRVVGERMGVPAARVEQLVRRAGRKLADGVEREAA